MHHREGIVQNSGLMGTGDSGAPICLRVNGMADVTVTVCQAPDSLLVSGGCWHCYQHVQTIWTVMESHFPNGMDEGAAAAFAL